MVGLGLWKIERVARMKSRCRYRCRRCWLMWVQVIVPSCDRELSSGRWEGRGRIEDATAKLFFGIDVEKVLRKQAPGLRRAWKGASTKDAVSQRRL